MIATLFVLSAALALCALYLWLISPEEARGDTGALEGWLYAHRGLHDQDEGATENSIQAFELAVKHGFGIELDVQLTKDDRLIVFHDGDLRRVCGVDGRICDMTYDELLQVPLPDGTRVPLFRDVLALVDGQTPLIVEVKHHGGAERNAEAALRLLRDYKGAYCVESFHPLAVRYFRRHAPDVVRGQLVWGGGWKKDELSAVNHFAMKHQLLNVLGRPNFVAHSVPNDRTLAMWLMKRLYKPPLAAWTIRDQAALDRADKDYDYPIFEGFMPSGERAKDNRS